MRIVKSAIAGSLLAVLWGNIAAAEEASALDLRQPMSMQRTAFEYDDYLYSAQPDDAGESPSDRPAEAVEESPSDQAGGAEICGDPCSRRRCGRSCRGCGGWTLPQPAFLSCRGITTGGWLEAGITGTGSDPALWTFPVAFNDRHTEAQMNQLWFYMDRTVDTGGYGWDVGGRVDFLYGTDAGFVQARELDGRWNQTEPFYQVALPQFYLDVAYNNLTVRMGHFLSVLGYEAVPAPENFFYSHSYTMIYAEPYTHTGLLAICDVNDQLSFSAGFHTGLDQIPDADYHNRLGFLGGVNWTSWNERLSLGFAIGTASQRPVDEFLGVRIPYFNGFVYSVVGSVAVTERLTYVIQHDYVQGVMRDIPVQGYGTVQAEAYGLNQYLLYDINPRWSAGLRFEWFRDNDGFYVWNRRNGDPIDAFDADPADFGMFSGNFYEISAGLNWTPRENIIFRPEIRWDWFDGTATPYDARRHKDQFTYGCDLIVTY